MPRTTKVKEATASNPAHVDPVPSPGGRALSPKAPPPNGGVSRRPPEDQDGWRPPPRRTAPKNAGSGTRPTTQAENVGPVPDRARSKPSARVDTRVIYCGDTRARHKNSCHEVVFIQIVFSIPRRFGIKTTSPPSGKTPAGLITSKASRFSTCQDNAALLSCRRDKKIRLHKHYLKSVQ